VLASYSTEAAGNTTVTQVPTPGVLVTSTVPPYIRHRAGDKQAIGECGGHIRRDSDHELHTPVQRGLIGRRNVVQHARDIPPFRVRHWRRSDIRELGRDLPQRRLLIVLPHRYPRRDSER